MDQNPDLIMKKLYKRHINPYNHQLGINNGQYKGFVLEEKSKRYFIMVKNKIIIEISDSKLQTLASKTKNSVIQKLNLYIGNAFIENLEEELYLFELVIGLKDVTFVDLLYQNGEYLEQRSYRDRLILLNELFQNMGSKMKILDTQPTLSIEHNNYYSMIIRNLLEFPTYSNDHILNPQKSINFVIVGQGKMNRNVRIPLKIGKYVNISEISPNAKRLLVDNYNKDKDKTKCQVKDVDERAQEDQKLDIYNNFKAHYFQKRQINFDDYPDKEYIDEIVDHGYPVYLLGGRNMDGSEGISIFGVTKVGSKLFKDNEIIPMAKNIPKLLKWDNEEYMQNFKPTSITYFENAYIVTSKQIHRTNHKILSKIPTNKILSYIPFNDIMTRANEIGYVPRVESNKQNTSPLNTASDDELYDEIIKRLHLKSVTVISNHRPPLKNLIINLSEQKITPNNDFISQIIRQAAHSEWPHANIDMENVENTITEKDLLNSHTSEQLNAKVGEKRVHWNNWDDNPIKISKQMDTDIDTDSYDSDSDDSYKKSN